MTVEYQIFYWRDIPAQVRLRAAGKKVSRPLAHRFQVAIDDAAMQSGATESGAYLEEWRTSDWQARDGELDELADVLVAEIEAKYSNAVVRDLIKQGGYESAAEQ
jgi:hypothetical protein